MILPAAVLSEVVNNLLKGFFLRNFLISENGKRALFKTTCSEKEYFKKLYRPTTQFQRDRQAIYVSILENYTDNIRLVDDHFSEVSYADLEYANESLDFTDWLIYRLAQKYDATIVSDDSDFMIENWPIVTNRHQLLALNPKT